MEHEMLRLEREISEVRSQQSAFTEQFKTVFDRLTHQDKVLDTLNELALSVRDLSHAQATTKERVDELCDDMDSIKAKPGKRWDNITTHIVEVVLTAVITYLLVKMGLG